MWLLVPLLTLLRSASSLRLYTLLSVERSPRCIRPRGGGGALMGPSKKEKERLVDELWASTEEESEANTDEDSHLHLEVDEDGDPVRRTGDAASGPAAEAPEVGPPKEAAAEAEDEVAQAGVDAREQREQREQVDEQGEQL